MRGGSVLPFLVAAAIAAGAVAAIAAPTATPASPLLPSALSYRERSLQRFRDDLIVLASKPSISSLPANADGVLAAAEWLKQKLHDIGLEGAQVIPTEGPQPVVYAAHEHAGPDAPTVLIYGHYDVQPVDPLALWEAPPFEPRVAGGFFWGRGVDDDKGGLLGAVHAVESYLKGPGKLPVNVKFLLEGQEEIGSPNLAAFLRAHKGRLFSGVDLALSADGGQISETQPGIPTGFRGAVALQVDMRTAHTDVHSGTLGGSIQNAAHALVQLLATLRDPATGRVAVEGFYDDVIEPTDGDRADMEKYPFDAAKEEGLGIMGYLGEAGRSTLERRWYRPTLEVVGMGSGFQGEGIKTIVPAAATAKLSSRLAANQRPDDITAKIKAHIAKHTPPYANVTVQVLGFRADPWTSPRDTPGNQAAARVLREVMGAEPLYFKEGGTVPALAYFQQALGVPTTVFSFSLGDHIHAPNERFKVSMFDLGSRAWVMLLDELGRAGRGAFAREGTDHSEL
ncbi:MAG: peptidase M20 [Monoraphidium minutum]|nr:MAG: peptidase M20 [Monoraphidium minutum]